MRRLLPLVRVSVGLVSLTVCILFTAWAVGLVPDYQGAVLQGRKSLCEALAIQYSAAAQRGQAELIRETVAEVVRRNAEIRSAGIRSADGQLLVEVGDHQGTWRDGESAHAGGGQMKVPIALHDKLWGTVELRFQPVTAPGLLGAFTNPTFRLMAFVALAGLAAYTIYLWRILRRILEVDHSSAVPRRIRATMDTLTEGVLILDRDQKIALSNEAFGQIAGQSPAELQGREASELAWVHTESGDNSVGYPWEQATREGATRMGVILGLQTESARTRTLSVNSTPILGNDGAQRGALATFDNLTVIEKKNSHLRRLLQNLKDSRAQVRRQNQELKALVTRDPLTSCLNRRAFVVEFGAHWQGAVRYRYSLSCVMVDLDHFKSINDRYGHSTGDQVLQHVAKTLRGLLRGSDLLCRYGGEEFCVLLPHVDIDDAWQAAERFRQGIASANFGNIPVTASMGVSAMSLGAREPCAMLDQADQALYAAKRAGRNRVIRWDRLAPAEEGKADLFPAIACQ